MTEDPTGPCGAETGRGGRPLPSGCLGGLLIHPGHPARGANIREIDARARGLVEALNCLPGVTTFSSCGGHAEPVVLSQVPHPGWYVKFGIEPEPEAHDSLARIMVAVKAHEPDASVFPWWPGSDYPDYEDVIGFRLGGECEPDVLVETLDAVSP